MRAPAPTSRPSSPPGGPRGQDRPVRGLRAAALVLTLVVLAVGAGCGKDDAATSGGGTTGTTAPVAAPVDYSTPGPYKVGTMTLTVGNTTAVVFYPADTASTATAKHVTSYSSGAAFTPELRGTVASLVPEFVQDIPIDAYQDAKINDEGPFPTVIHSHGFGGFNLFASQHFVQEASWGFVVAAPDHRSRDLSAAASGQLQVEGDPDVQDLRATLAAVGAEDANPKSPLYAGVDTKVIGAEGHSAGGRASYLFAASEPNVKAWIGQAPSAPIRFDQADRNLPADEQLAKQKEALAAAPVLNRPSMIVAGEKDSVIPLAGPQLVYGWLQTPKRLLVVANAGHASFIDVCKPIRTQGGLQKYAEALPAFAPMFKLGDDGCAADNIDPAQASAFINHVMIAQYRYTMGFDPTPVSLSDAYLRATFPAAFGSQQSAQ